MAISSVSNYGAMYESTYALRKKEADACGQGRSKEAGATEAGRKNRTSVEERTRTESNQEYLKGLQKKAPYMNLELGTGLSMNRDKRAGVLTINPKLLEKMQNDPEAEKKYTQLVKDIERAEKTGDAYYNALGGVVERTSHWYIDENGKYYHFAYTRRDDKLNKKIRQEAKENAEKLIEKTREKARKKAKELKEQLETKAEEAREEEAKAEGAKEENKNQKPSENIQTPKDVVAECVEQLLTEKLENSENGEICLNEEDMQPIMEAIREEDAATESRSAETPAGTKGTEVGAAVDLKV